MTKRTMKYEKLMAWYEKEMVDHELLLCDGIDRSRALLRVGRPGSSVFLFDAAISLRHVVVYGDIDVVAFCGGDNVDWRGQLAWIGAPRPDYDYCAAKACRAMGHAAVYERDDEVAKEDLLDLRRGRVVTREAAASAWRKLSHGTREVEEVAEQLYLDGADAESVSGLGEVVSSRVLLGIAALRTAHRLVEAEQ